MKMNQESIYTLKGIGEKTGKLLEKLGIFTVDDLLHDYPRAYHTYESPVRVGDLKPDTTGTVGGLLQKDVSVKRLSHIQVITVTFQDETGKLQLTWFNMPFLRATLKAGTYHIFHGKVIKKNGRLTMEQPEIFTRESYEAMMQTMQPVYGQTKGLNNKTIIKAVSQALEYRQMEREYLPADIRKKYQLAEYNFALERIHFPDDRQELLFARKRLVFDEFFLFLLAVRKLREKRMDHPSRYVMAPVPEVEAFQASLPYELTGAQQKVLKEIQTDLASGQMMNRLVQGDVGSGKTILAILALLQTAYHDCLIR